MAQDSEVFDSLKNAQQSVQKAQGSLVSITKKPSNIEKIGHFFGKAARETTHTVGKAASETVHVVGKAASKTVHVVGKVASKTIHVVGKAATTTARTAVKVASIPAYVTAKIVSETVNAVAKIVKGTATYITHDSRKPLKTDNLFVATYEHYVFGGGKPLYVDTSSLHLANISQSALKKQSDGTYLLNTVDVLGISDQTALALGKISLIPDPIIDNQFTIATDTYDFNNEPNGSAKRNIFTAIGKGLHNISTIPVVTPVLGINANPIEGHSFKVVFMGVVTIKP